MSNTDEAVDRTEEAVDAKEASDGIEELRQKLESANKRIDDTFSAYQRGQEKIAELERSMAREALAASKPAILDEAQGLQEAIRYVNELDKRRPSAEDEWIAAVTTAIPDIDGLMDNDQFKAEASRARDAVGISQWHNPLLAIRALSQIKADIMASKMVEDDRRSKTKTSAMDIPGGGKRPSPEKEENDAEKIMSMSNEEFRKMRNKVLGYNS